MSWHRHGACYGGIGVDFFDETRAGIARAKAVCADCPVRADCFEHAIALHEFDGVWGGASPDEIRREWRRRLRAARKQPRSA